MSSLLHFHINPLAWQQVLAAYIIWTTAMIFIRVKRIHELVVDLDDKNITLKGKGNDKQDKATPNA